MNFGFAKARSSDDEEESAGMFKSTRNREKGEKVSPGIVRDTDVDAHIGLNRHADRPTPHLTDRSMREILQN